MPHVIPQFPHCEASVLHAPSKCEYCDLHPDWQELREIWGINFTGENDPNKIPCPSTRRRPLNSVHAWPGNRPKAPDGVVEELPPPDAPKSVYDHLRDNKFK